MHKEQVLNYVSSAQMGTSLDSKRLSCLLRFNLVPLFKWIASQKEFKKIPRKPVLDKVLDFRMILIFAFLSFFLPDVMLRFGELVKKSNNLSSFMMQ